MLRSVNLILFLVTVTMFSCEKEEKNPALLLVQPEEVALAINPRRRLHKTERFDFMLSDGSVCTTFYTYNAKKEMFVTARQFHNNGFYWTQETTDPNQFFAIKKVLYRNKKQDKKDALERVAQRFQQEVTEDFSLKETYLAKLQEELLFEKEELRLKAARLAHQETFVRQKEARLQLIASRLATVEQELQYKQTNSKTNSQSE